MAAKAPLASPTFTGVPIVPTAAVGTITGQASSTSYVDNELGAYGIGQVKTETDFQTPTEFRAFNAVSGATNQPASGMNYAALALPGSNANNVGMLAFGLSATAPRVFVSNKFGAVWSGWIELAKLDSPAFSGTPTVPTATAGTNTLQAASTAFVTTAVGAASGGYTATIETAGFTETSTSGEKIRECDLAAGFTVALPTAVGNTSKLTYKKIQAAGAIILDPFGSETIDDGSTATLTRQYESITLYSNNVNWRVM